MYVIECLISVICSFFLLVFIILSSSSLLQLYSFILTCWTKVDHSCITTCAIYRENENVNRQTAFFKLPSSPLFTKTENDIHIGTIES